MSEMVFVVGANELSQKVQTVKGLLQSNRYRTLLEDTKNVLVALARNDVPRRSSLLYNRISGRVEGFGTDQAKIVYGVIGPVESKIATYGAAQEYGAKPHPIYPNRRKVLVWYSKGFRGEKIMAPGLGVVPPAGATKHVRRWVFHPGNPARPYLRPQLGKVRPRFIMALTRLINETLKGSK